MVFIDVHNHLDFYSDDKIEMIIRNAAKNSVKIIVVNGVNPKSNKRVLKLSLMHPYIKASLGFYPSDCVKLDEKEIEKEIKFVIRNKDKIVSIGEIGLDLKELDTLERQKSIFVNAVRLAKNIKKPVIVHSRKAEKIAIEVLEKEKIENVVMHCFNGNLKLVKRIIQNNWAISIPANVKHSEHFQKIIEIAPLKNLFCETDSPFLHPDKKRDNEPSNVIESYKKLQK